MKLKSYVNRKRLAIELVLFDIIAIQLAAFFKKIGAICDG